MQAESGKVVAVLADVFGLDRLATRMVYGVASLPRGVCTVAELVLELAT